MTLTPSVWQRVREGRAPDPDLVADVAHEEVGALGAGRVAASREALTSRVLGAGVLEPWLAQPGVTDVAVNGDGRVWVDRGHGMEWVGEVIEPDEARALAVRLAGIAGRRLDEASPWVDGQLPSGARLHAVLPPLVSGGPHITIRVPSSEQVDLPGLLRRSMFPAAWYDVLERIVRRRLSFVVSGGTGAGKTTLLAALLGGVHPAERILVVEDVRELHVAHPHVIRLEARPANVEGAGEVTLETLVRQALRMRPDRIVVGEVRGAEVRELLAALNTGHEGGCGTVHANAPEDVIARFEALGALAGLGSEAVRAQLAAAIDLVIHVARHTVTRGYGQGLDPAGSSRAGLAPTSMGPEGLDPAGPGLEPPDVTGPGPLARGRDVAAFGEDDAWAARQRDDAASAVRSGAVDGTRHIAAIAAVFRRESGPCIVPALGWDGPGHAWTREAAWPALAARLGLPAEFASTASAPGLASAPGPAAWPCGRSRRCGCSRRCGRARPAGRSSADGARMRPAVVALLLTMAVLAWPVRDRIGRAAAVLGAGSEAGGQSRHGGSAGQVARAVTRRGPVSLGGIWHQDPVEVFRRWRLRRKPDDVIASALALLDATEPALVAGLPPSTAIGLAVAAVETGGHDADGVDRASSLPEPGRPASRAGVLTPAIGRLATHVSRPGGSGRVSGARVTRPTTGRQLGVALADSARQGHSVAAVWADYADRTGSRDLAFVAAAWSLSEDTGVPLAVAVARAAAGLREARTRRRRVAVAVAGPKATVAVLTVLPLTGPLFGLACGVGPAELYGGHPIGAASAAAGFLLMVVGRFWCRRMIRRAVTP